MENIIRLPSQQARFDARNRLVDLVIPANSGVYDLSQCYIAIDTSVNGLQLDTTEAPQGRLVRTAGYILASEAVADVRMGIKHNATADSIYDTCAMPVSVLVRNASMFSATRGKVEDIRRVDTLRGTMNAYVKDIEDIENDAIGGLGPSAKKNIWASGRYVQMVGIGETSSGYKSHEIRIFLKDIFNVGRVEAWDSAKMGDTRIHLELNLDRANLVQVLGPERVMWGEIYHNDLNGATYPANVSYGQAVDVVIPSGTTSYSDDTILMKAEYASIDDSPFFTNQMLAVTTTFTGGTVASEYPASGDVRWAVVKGISWDKTTRQITLDFGGEALATGAVSVADTTVTRTVEGVSVTATTLPTALSFETVELTAVRRSDMEQGPDQLQYTQFMTTSDQFTNGSTLNRSYHLPAQTQTAFIVLPSRETRDFSDILGCARLGQYRFTLNGESVTNRPIPYMPTPILQDASVDTKLDKGSALHYNLVGEAMMNSAISYHSLREAVYDQNIPLSKNVPSDNGVYGWQSLAIAPTKACYLLALPVPISNAPTQLTIELDGSFPNGNGELHIFSEVRSVL
mgnify:FL=1